MKKAILGLIALSAMTLASCDTDSKDTTGTNSYNVATLVTDLSTGESFVTPASYSVFMNFTQGKGSVSTKNQALVNTAGNSNTFVSDTTTFDYKYFETENGNGDAILFKNLKGNMNEDKTLSLNNFKFIITSLFYQYPGTISGIPNMIISQPAVLMNYDADGKYNVKTIPSDAVYLGNTITNMESVSYTNGNMGYRIVFDFTKKTAQLIMYKAKFAEKMPELTAIVLNNLPVEFRNGSYSIKGENIVPQVPEGGKLIDNETYKFDNINISITDELLTKAIIRFTVAGKFSGVFTGEYVLDKVVSGI